jgi:hypothetical protein
MCVKVSAVYELGIRDLRSHCTDAGESALVEIIRCNTPEIILNGFTIFDTKGKPTALHTRGQCLYRISPEVDNKYLGRQNRNFERRK